MKEKRQNFLLALLISIILTLLLLSTYESSYHYSDINGKEIKWERKGIPGLIENILDNNIDFVIVSLMVFSTIFFCIELIVSYFVIGLLRKKLKKK